MRQSIVRRRHVALFTLAMTAAGLACSSSSDEPSGASVTCGTGTRLDGTQCIAISSPESGPGSGADVVPADGAPGSAAPPTFAGVTSAAPAALTSLQVTWNAATDAVTPAARIAYNVYVATAAGAQNFSTPTAIAPPGSTSLLINTLAANTSYFVVVRAVNEAKVEDLNKTELPGKTQADTAAPTFAGATTAEAAPGSSLKISWAAATDDLTPAPGMTYLVYLASTAGGQDLSGPSHVSDVGASSIVIPGLAKPDATYYAIVRARDASGNMDSNKLEVSGKTGTDTVAPTFSGCTSATVKDADSVTVSWNEATDDTTLQSELTYDVFASKTPGGQDFTTPTRSFTAGAIGVVSGLSSASAYYFVCRARDLSKNSDQNKSERTATTLSDGVPPTFAGLTSVTNVLATSVDLNWAAGSDDQAATGDIVYDVYQATSPSAETFTVPSASSAAGATSMTLTGLDSATTYYWIVRARDKAGNHDANVVEKNAVTSVSFSQNVMPIMIQHCAVQGCHLPGNPPVGLVLAPASVAYGNIYNVNAVEVPSMKRVAPSSPANSYFYKKLVGPVTIGEIMPPAIQNDALTAAEKTIVQNWILQGALQN